MGLPEQLWKPLYQKLQTATYDIRDRVEVSSSDGKPRFGELKANLTDAELAAESDVFLLGSLWTTTATTALQSLENSPWLLEDMEGVTGVYEPQDGLPAMPDTSMSDESAEADVAAVMSQACVDEARARQLLQKTGGDIIEAIMAASETDTSVADQSSVQTQILQQLEAGGQDGQPLQWRTHNYECIQYSLDGTDQLDSIDIRLHLGQAVRASDIANTVTTTHIKVSVGDSVVLDGDLHAPVEAAETTWTLEAGVLSISLVKRTAAYWPQALVGEKRINPMVRAKHLLRVAREAWRVFQGCDCMSLVDGRQVRKTAWFLPDHMALALEHSDDPNTRCVPFLYADAQGTAKFYCVLWPIKTIGQGDRLTRDFCPAWLADPQQRRGYLQAIIGGPTQFALDAYERCVAEWKQVAVDAVRADLAPRPAPKQALRSLFVRNADQAAVAAIAAGGFTLAARAEDADIVFDEDPHPGQRTNQHSFNAVFFSTENATTILQRIGGAQDWLSAGFLLKTQLAEFVGAALMHTGSWWVVRREQAVAGGVESPTLLTSDWAAAVRHVDVGYETAMNCPPSAVIGDRLFLVERLVLLTPEAAVFVTAGSPRIYQHVLRAIGDGLEPYQMLEPPTEVSEEVFRLQTAQQLGTDGYARLVSGIDRAIVDVMRLLLGLDAGNGQDFGVFRLRFVLGQSLSGTPAPALYEARPMSVAAQLAAADDFVPSVAAVLAGSPNAELWRQIS